jgi:hypothetical protein
MSDHWIILLDQSSSMEAPFSSNYKFSGHTESGDYRTKLEAAKDRLIKEVCGLTNSTVSVVAFSDDAQVVCTADCVDYQKIARSLDQFPGRGGGTELALALTLAHKTYRTSAPSGFTSILVISDGLADEFAAEHAAKQCAASRIPISTILIDPTEDGERLARKISIGGKVSGVTSEQQFSEAMDSARSEHAMASKRAEAAQDNVPTAILGIVAGVAAIVGASVAITGIFTQVIASPTIALPISVSASCVIAAAVMTWIATSKVQSPNGIYLSSSAPQPHFPKVPRFERRTRFVAIMTAIGAIVGAVFLLTLAWANHHSREDDGGNDAKLPMCD